MNEQIKRKLKLLPKQPGVYIMKNDQGVVIYVGKAKVLKNRVTQYFVGIENHLPKVRAMVENIEDFDYIVCFSEMETLILESNMIKEYMPRYNILLKDDKHYPYVKVEYDKKYPRIAIVRRVQKDNAKYYGPYLNSSNLRNILEYVYTIYPLRTCKKNLEGKKEARPCLNYQIGRCMGPCAFEVDEEKYNANLKEVVAFLKGKTAPVKDMLRQKMLYFSENLEFEKAQKYKEVIENIDMIITPQYASVSSLDDRDIVAVALADQFAMVELLIMRGGKILGEEHFKLDLNNEDEDVLSSFLTQYYNNEIKIPKEILLPYEVDEIIVEHINSIKKCDVIVPKIGKKRQMVLMAKKNAVENVLKQKNDRKWFKTKGAVLDLGKVLNIEGEILRMECYDISHTKGRDMVGSMVVFTKGVPDKKEYRRFNIKDQDKIDDYAALRQMLRRRLTRAIEEQSQGIEGKFSLLPDLFVIDGGKGQVNACYNLLCEMGFAALPIIGIAEREEEIFLPNTSEPIILSRRSGALKIVQGIRDEAHRFAITFHRTKRSKTQVKSVLDDIKGVGKVRKTALLKHFKSVDKIKSASLEELLQSPSMDERTARTIVEFFKEHKGEE